VATSDGWENRPADATSLGVFASDASPLPAREASQLEPVCQAQHAQIAYGGRPDERPRMSAILRSTLSVGQFDSPTPRRHRLRRLRPLPALPA
jgi:hypothetical protein